jgi:hypothetical protein
MDSFQNQGTPHPPDDSHKETAPTVDTSPQFKTLEEDEDVLLKV